MADMIDRDGFRANVGIVLMHDDGRLFIGRRTGGKGWQFPQGGVRRGETAEESLFRELNEEIGLSSEGVRVVGPKPPRPRHRPPPPLLARGSQPPCGWAKQR